MYEKSTKQMVALLESFASDLAVNSPGDDSQDSEHFDSLLSRSHFDSDSHRSDSDNIRPCIDSYKTIPSSPGLERDKAIPSKFGEDRYSRKLNSKIERDDKDSYKKLVSMADRNMSAWNSYGYGYGTLPGRLSNNKVPARSDSYGMLTDSYG
jgi:hypothetical protein